MNQPFTSYYFDPTKSIRKNKKNESFVDFYILFSENVSIDNICAFHVPFSYIFEYSHTSFHSEEESFIVEILLHQKVNYVLNNSESKIEELYLSLLEYFCFGEDFFLTLNSNPNGGFGIIALYDKIYFYPTITSFIETEVNKERFHYQDKKRK